MSQLKVDTLTDELGTGAPDFPNGATSGGSDVYAKGNILGTVSESNGVPTGAVIERGSNANGEFVKYADGTLICSGFNIGTGRDESEARNTWIDGNTISWPHSFAFAPSFSGEFQGSRATGNITQMHILGWTSRFSSDSTFFNENGFKPIMFKPLSAFGMSSFSDGEIRVKYNAIGRWY